jgi:hypothetical protein
MTGILTPTIFFDHKDSQNLQSDGLKAGVKFFMKKEYQDALHVPIV